MKLRNLLLVLMCVPMLTACGVQTVDAGSSGVKKTLGKIDPNVLERL